MLRNLSWLGASNVLVKPLWFVFITAYAVRRLGPPAYGSFTAASALAGIVTGLCLAGTAAVTVRDVARDRSMGSHYWSNLLPVRVLLALVAFGVTEGVGRLLGQPATLLRAAWLFWFAYSLLEYTRAFFRAVEQMRFEAETVILEKGFTIVGGGVALFIIPTPVSLLLGMSAGTALAAAYAAWRVHRYVLPLSIKHLDGDLIRRTMRAAIPLGLSAVFIAIYMRIDVIMVEHLVGETEAGLYGVAYRFLEALSQMPELLMIVLLPRLSVLHGQRAHRSSTQLMRTSLLALVGVSLVVSGALTLCADWLLHLLTPEAATAAPLLRLLVWVFPLAAVNYAFSTALIARDDQQALMWRLGLAALLNVCINLLLIPRYGGLGAAGATVATESVLALLLAVRYNRPPGWATLTPQHA